MTENHPIPTLPDTAEIIDALRDSLMKVLPPEDLAQVDFASLGPETPLLSLPVDSAALMSLMTDLEDKFTVFIDDEAAFSFNLVADVADYVRQRLTDKVRRLANS